MEGICTVLGVYESGSCTALPYERIACCVHELAVCCDCDGLGSECYLCNAVGLNACELESSALYLGAAHVGLLYRNAYLLLGVVEHLYLIGAVCSYLGAACCDSLGSALDKSVLDCECELGLDLLKALGSCCLFESVLTVGEILDALGSCT